MATAQSKLHLTAIGLGIFFSSVAIAPAISIAADRKADQRTENRNRLHGPVEFLNQSLEISSTSHRLLVAASRELAQRNYDSGFQALLHIFSQPDEVIPPVDGKSPGSSHLEAFQLLAQMDTETRTSWVETAEPLAKKALHQAAGDSNKLATVARRYPFTPSGTQAISANAFLARSKGQHHLAEAFLSQMELMSIRDVSSLRHQLQEDRSSSKFSNIAGQAFKQLPNQLSLPWTQPKWQWSEQLWKHPETTIFSPLLDPLVRSMFTLNSWHPTLYDDSIYLKTPFHVVAFDKSDGKIQWSLTTDTLRQIDQSKIGESQQPSGTANFADILRRDSMGTVAVSENFVFFVDHFRIFQTQNSNFQFSNRRAPRAGRIPMPPPSRNGSRLVAVRRSTLPSVAWQIGDSPDFNYAPVKGKLSSLTPPQSSIDGQTKRNEVASTTDSVAESSEDFSGQHFCGVPAIHDQMLFVISQDREAYWLNCLTEATGRLQWKTILAHVNDDGNRRGRFLINAVTDHGASLCGVSGEVVVCALNNGLVLGSRITDGQFLWATNLRDDLDPVSQAQLMNMLARSINLPQGIRSQPLLNNDRLYWAAPFSNNVHCVDTATGEVLWKVPRATTGKGRLEGSTDRYVAGVTNSAAVMVGARHVRALSRENGSELWATPIRDQTGRAFCNQDSCLIPLIDGTLIQIDNSTGNRNIVGEVIARGGSRLGAIVADEEVVCMATPLSISVVDTSEVVSENSQQHTLQHATAAVLTGNVTDALADLKQIATGTSDVQGSRQADHLLAESLLNLPLTGNNNLSPTDEWITETFDGLKLSAQQQIRRAIRFGQPMESETRFEFADGLPNLQIEHDWTARADVAAWSNLSFEDARQVADVNDPDRSWQSRVEHAILYPEHLGAFDRKMDFVRSLISKQRHSAAELFLLSARESANASEVVLIDNEITRLRSRFVSSPLAQPRAEILSLEISEKQGLAPVSNIALLRSRIRMHVDSPDWYPNRLFVSGRTLVAASLDYGVETSQLRLPDSPNDLVELPAAFETPSIIPIAAGESIGAISLLNPDGPQILWWRRFEKSKFDNSTIKLGPFGANYLTVSVGTEFLCLHPLTGKELWRRQTSDDIRRQGMLNRFPRLIGNETVMVRPGQRMKSYELFRTSDGKMLDTVGLDIPDGQTPLTSGHSILYLRDRKLVLHHLPTQKNLLAEQPPITVMGAGQAMLLSNHRAITLTDEMDLLVLDLRSGEVQTRCSVADILDRDKFVGLKAFERHGSLFVVLKDWNSARSNHSASSRMGDIKLDSGLLCRIDLKSGQLLWHRQIVPCVAPVIHGTETNLMITWSWKSKQNVFQRQLGRQLSDSNMDEMIRTMVVTAINLDTGETVSEASKLNPSEPLRCVHDDQQNRITLESETSVIHLRYD